MNTENRYEQALLSIGELTVDLRAARTLLASAYVTGPDGELYHYRCGEKGVEVENGQIVPACRCFEDKRKGTQTADSEGS